MVTCNFIGRWVVYAYWTSHIFCQATFPQYIQWSVTEVVESLLTMINTQTYILWLNAWWICY